MCTAENLLQPPQRGLSWASREGVAEMRGLWRHLAALAGRTPCSLSWASRSSLANCSVAKACLSDPMTPWTASRQASPSYTISRSLLKLMSIESVMPSNHLILCRPLLLLPSVFPSIRVFSNESAQHQVAKVLELQL